MKVFEAQTHSNTVQPGLLTANKIALLLQGCALRLGPFEAVEAYLLPNLCVLNSKYKLQRLCKGLSNRRPGMHIFIILHEVVSEESRCSHQFLSLNLSSVQFAVLTEKPCDLSPHISTVSDGAQAYPEG